jgi:hypothetical protein
MLIIILVRLFAGGTGAMEDRLCLASGLTDSITK